MAEMTAGTAKAKGGRGRVDARFLAEAVSRERSHCEDKDRTTAFGRYDEHHLSYAIARALEDSRDAWVVVEGTDGDRYKKGQRCDVYARLRSGQDLWVEVKRAWPGGEGWVGKPREQLKTWLRDLQKLRRFPRSSRCAFVMLAFAQNECHDATPPWVAGCGARIGARLKQGSGYLDLLPPQRMNPPVATALMEAVLRAMSPDFYVSPPEQGIAPLADGTKPWYRVFAAIF